jgi:hypothetical protein
MVRAFVVAPAHVQAHPISGNVPQGVIKGRHVKLSDLLELPCAQVGKPIVAAHAQVGAVHLKYEAGAVDDVVFLFQGVRQGVQILLLAPVVLVFHEVRHHARRGGGHEYLFGFDFFDGGLQVFNVLAHGVPILPSDGADARGALGGSSSRAAGGVFREVLGFTRDGGSRTFTLEAGEAVFHVSGVTGLALLAVIEDSDPDLGLPLHHLRDRRADAYGKDVFIHRLLLLLAQHHVH